MINLLYYSEKTLCSNDFTGCMRDIFINIILTMIPTNLVLPFFVLLKKPGTTIKFSASSWSGSKKYFFALFTKSRSLLQNHTYTSMVG